MSYSKIISNKFLPIIAILSLAIFLRVFALNQVPSGLFGDEIDVGYQAYSLLHTGRDLYGNFLPIYVRALAEYRAPLYIYGTIPFVGIFGLNEWGVRLPAAFWGVISIFGIYLLTKHLFERRAGLWAALLLTISPWHLQYSRASFEVTMLIAFVIFAACFFLLGLKKKKFMVFSAILFGLSLYIYSTATVFVPLLILLLGALNWRNIINNKKLPIFFGAVFIIVILPMLWFIYNGQARERFSLVSIFQDSVLLDKINIARTGQEYFTIDGEMKKINPQIEPFFHNKVTVFTQVFTLNYLRAFSPEFLFATGDPNFRQSIHEMGLLYYFELIFILAGVGFLILKTDRKLKLLIFGWLLLSPIPAALTYNGGFHATRLFLMIVPITIIEGVGAVFLLTLVKNNLSKLLIILLLIVAVFNITFYFHRYYVHYPIESWRWWQIGYKEAMGYISSNEQKYQTVVINNTYEPALERFLFYTNYDPATFQKQFFGDKSTENIISGVQGFSLGEKFYFGMLGIPDRGAPAFEKVMKPGMLYLASARDEVEGRLNAASDYQHFRVVKSIYSPDGEPIFYLLEGK